RTSAKSRRSTKPSRPSPRRSATRGKPSFVLGRKAIAAVPGSLLQILPSDPASKHERLASPRKRTPEVRPRQNRGYLMRLSLAAYAFAIACAGTASAEPRNLAGFTRVDASAGNDVTVTVGPNYSVDVSGPGADQVVTRISGQTLVIERPHSFHWGARP